MNTSIFNNILAAWDANLKQDWKDGLIDGGTSLAFKKGGRKLVGQAFRALAEQIEEDLDGADDEVVDLLNQYSNHLLGKK